MHKITVIPKHQIIILNCLFQLIKFIHIILKENNRIKIILFLVFTHCRLKNSSTTQVQKYGIQYLLKFDT